MCGDHKCDDGMRWARGQCVEIMSDDQAALITRVGPLTNPIFSYEPKVCNDPLPPLPLFHSEWDTTPADPSVI